MLATCVTSRAARSPFVLRSPCCAERERQYSLLKSWQLVQLLGGYLVSTTRLSYRLANQLFAESESCQIYLTGVPRTALPNDLWRLCGKVGISNVDNGTCCLLSEPFRALKSYGVCLVVSIEYSRFRPTGAAILSFTRPEFVPAAVKALDKALLSGKTLGARPAEVLHDIPRGRGVQGALEAAQRGVVHGNGPDAGLTGGGKNVVIWGLPGKMYASSLIEQLRGFKLAGAEQGRPVVIKLDP